MEYRELFTAEERVSFKLRARYRAQGFVPYRMSKFEEYDLYAKNKDFLVSREIITFTDTDGKLMALKPDVTLSIAKNFDSKTPLQKLYYNETVYRPSQSGGFREILQSGVECMGEVTAVEQHQVLALAAACLADISERFVLSVSDLGLLDELFLQMNLPEDAQEALCNCIRSKNVVEAERLCRENAVDSAAFAALKACILTSAPLSEAVGLLEGAFESADLQSALASLKALAQSERLADDSNRVIFDFSVLPNRRFYNGTVFSGYVAGVPSAVLSGGSYDKLMLRLKKTGGAIGFAVYLDRLPSEEEAE